MSYGSREKSKKKPWVHDVGRQAPQTGSGYHCDKRQRRSKNREYRDLMEAMEYLEDLEDPSTCPTGWTWGTTDCWNVPTPYPGEDLEDLEDMEDMGYADYPPQP